MLRRNIVCALVIANLALCAAFSSRAAEKGDESDNPSRPPEAGPDGLPKFKHPYTDGLYSTVTAMNMFWVPEVEKQKKLKLKVQGFKKEMPVYAIMQDYQAPLVVVLMGVDGKVDGPWGGLFPYWYCEAGFHVLTFESSFTPTYPAINGQGVVGNFEAEALQIGAIIDAFLKTGENQKKVTKVGVVGMSFGALQALHVAAKAKEGALPFELSGCLAICPPVKLHTAAQVLDKYFAEDRWDTTMVELAQKFMPHVPVAEGQKPPFSASEMRAAIGFAFRDGLTKVVERNDEVYKLNILPSADSEENRGSYAEATGFVRFMEKFTFPYWQKKGAVKSPDDLWNMGDLSKLLPKLPPYAEAVVAANDPFTTPEDLKDAKDADVNHRLSVVPNGGHLGFLSSDWLLVKALRIFGKKDAPAAVQSSDKRTPDDARREARDAAREALNRDVPPSDNRKKQNEGSQR